MVLVQLLILVPRTYHTYLYFMYGYNCSIGPMIRTCLQLAAQADKPINRLLVTTEYCSLACLPVYYSSCTWYYGSIAVAVLLSAICGYTRQPGKRGMIRIQYVKSTTTSYGMYQHEKCEPYVSFPIRGWRRKRILLYKSVEEYSYLSPTCHTIPYTQEETGKFCPGCSSYLRTDAFYTNFSITTAEVLIFL